MIYHYTSLESGVKILQSCQLPHREESYFVMRASRYDCMNDPSESKLLEDALKQSMGIDKLDLSVLKGKDGDPFVISFSNNKDDLNMWRSYANNGCGIALGVDEYTIQDVYSNWLKECKYATTEKIIETITNSRDYPIKKNRITEFEEYGIRNLTPIQEILELSQMMYKSLEYETEHEFRLVVRSHTTADCLYVRGNTIVPYTNVHIPTAALKEIWVGPCLEYDIIEELLYVILRDCWGKGGEGICIQKSDCSYRRV